MDNLVESLEAVDAALGEIVDGVFADRELEGVSDDVLLTVVGLAARIARRSDALLIEGAGRVDCLATVQTRDDRITNRFGCRSANDLLQRVTRASSRSVADLLKAGRAVIREVAASSGELLPAEYPALRGELAAGRLGVDAVVAVTGALSGVAAAAGRAAHLAADEELAAAARGEGADGGPMPCADDLRALATVWAAYLDQDGAEPRESAAMRKRGLTLGMCRDGLVPLRGNLLPEVAAQFQLVADSILNPKADPCPTPSGPRFAEADRDADEASGSLGDGLAKERTHPQRLHDAFATALTKLAGSGALPTLGGAPPTLVVSVRAEDVESGRGYAHIEGCDEPVSLSLARQIACCGSVQRVITESSGRIVAIETSDRIFNHLQRKAIGLRDGGCVVPGCRVRASWCEVHHVHEHSMGGPTHTDNGVLLCWFHHRTLDTSGWKIRMNRGIPEVRGPAWWDWSGTWHPATSSPIRMRDRHARRT